MKAAIYARKSRFTGKGDSINNQIDLCIAKAKSLGIEDFKIYHDEGFSGANIDRPAFNSMITDIKSGEFTHMICYKVDRVSRSTRDFIEFIGTLDDLLVNFISVSDSLDLSTPIGRMFLNIIIGFAELEYDTIRERITANVYALARNGNWLGGKSPYGFDSKINIYIDEYGKQRQYTHLEPNYSKMSIVNIIFEEYLKVKSLGKLKNYLDCNGYKSDNNLDFDISSLSLILRNPVYVKSTQEVIDYLLTHRNMEFFGEVDGISGFLTYGKHSNQSKRKTNIISNSKKNTSDNNAILAIAKHKGVIDSDIWLEVQQLLDKNAQKAPRAGTGTSSLLSGLLRCGICGKSMGITYKLGPNNKIVNKYYVCNTKRRFTKSKCDCKNLSGYKIESQILDKVKHLDIHKFIDYYNNTSTKIYSKQEILLNQIEDINSKIKNIKSKISNLIIKLSDNSSSSISEYISTQINNFDNEIKELEEQKLSLSTELELLKNNNGNIVDAINSIKNFESTLLSSNIEEQRNLLTAILDKVVWNPQTKDIEMYYKGFNDTNNI